MPQGKVDWQVSVHSTTSRAHVHAAGARRDSSEHIPAEPVENALGRSRGGWTTKIHLACEQHRHALAFVLTGGQAHDGPQMISVLEQIRVSRPGPGRPRTRPDRVLGDKAYPSRANRAYLARRGIKATIPVKDDQAAHRRAREATGGTTTSFRPGRLPRPSRRRVRHQRRQTQTRVCHPLRQARRPIRRHHVANIDRWLKRHS
jgi:hypothetical protein